MIKMGCSSFNIVVKKKEKNCMSDHQIEEKRKSGTVSSF